MISTERLEQYRKALVRQIGYIDRRGPGASGPARCYVSLIEKMDCSKCDLCPMFVPAPGPLDKHDLRYSAHPCNHIPYAAGPSDPKEMDGTTNWKLIWLREMGVLSRVDYYRIYNAMVPVVLCQMLAAVEMMLAERQKAESTEVVEIAR